MSEAIRVDVTFKAAPERVYRALTDAAQFSAFTGGAPATIEAKEGGAFSGFGGMIVGRNLELVPGKRVVQAWRVKEWPEGVYSIARFDLAVEGAGTRLSFEHAGFPAAMRPHLEGGWAKMYWEPLAKFFA